jgi:predicted Zn-dependent peptidase
MLFQGRKMSAKASILLVQNNGGAPTARPTSTVPTISKRSGESARAGIFLEADRMRAPAITQANFDNQRLTVQEERRQSYDNRPYGKTTKP